MLLEAHLVLKDTLLTQDSPFNGDGPVAVCRNIKNVSARLKDASYFGAIKGPDLIYQKVNPIALAIQEEHGEIGLSIVLHSKNGEA